MWEKLRPAFKGFPAQEKVAQLMVVHGLRVQEERVFAGPIEVSDTAMARAAGVDRRVVTATLRTIGKNPELLRFFERLMPVCHLGEVAPLMGWGAIEIIPTSASKPGILAGVAGTIAEAGISVRQVIVDDPEVSDDPHAFIVTEQPVPERLLPRIKAVEGVKSVVLY
ncbi:MAG: ACT domain-containing protein [Methanobacteriota archaeon]|nr:MAG: ACT domain-containing protein [Euryarchaeota archaeon]